MRKTDQFATHKLTRKERRRHMSAWRHVLHGTYLDSRVMSWMRTTTILTTFKMTEFHAELVPSSETLGVSSNYIPASTPQVHASNLLRLPSGDLLCAWFGGSQEGLSDICVGHMFAPDISCASANSFILADTFIAASQRRKSLD